MSKDFSIRVYIHAQLKNDANDNAIEYFKHILNVNMFNVETTINELVNQYQTHSNLAYIAIYKNGDRVIEIDDYLSVIERKIKTKIMEDMYE